MEDFGRVVGVDIEPLALTLYREGHGGKALAGLTVADVGHLPFADGHFDAVLCVTVLCHRSIAAPAAVVGELARVLRPGGVVALWEPGVRRLRRAHDRVTHSARRFSRRDLARLCEANDLDVVRSTGAHAYLIPAAAGKAVLERGRVASDLDQHADWPRRRAGPPGRRRAGRPAPRGPARRPVGPRHRPQALSGRPAPAIRLVRVGCRLARLVGVLGLTIHSRERRRATPPSPISVGSCQRAGSCTTTSTAGSPPAA